MADDRAEIWQRYGRLIRVGTLVVMGALLAAFLAATAIMTSGNVSETTDLVYSLKAEYLKSNVDQLINALEAYRADELGRTAAERGVAVEDLSADDVAAVDERVQRYAEDVIYAEDFRDGSYIWVNQVVDYDGGDGYAIRRIHPNLRDTVGTELSTDTTDIAGNHPYRDELEGVKAHPEGYYYTYYFKELNSDTVSEKYTYARLYERYDWIVAMGVYVNEIDEYAGRARAAGRRVALVGAVVLLVAMSVFAVGVYYVSKRRLQSAYDTASAELRQEAHHDALTGCWNRGYGDKLARRAFADFRSGRADCGILIVDVDEFKEVNDTYGHAAGDRALRTVAAALKDAFRSGDRVVRWGGDEFVVILNGFKAKGADTIEGKLRGATGRLRIEADGREIRLTLSAGLAVYEAGDDSYKAAVNRADEALYEAKTNGRARMCRRL